MTARLNGQALPEGWMWTSLDEITDSIQYGHTESASTQKIGPKFLRITDIQDGQVDWSSVPYCKCSDAEHQKYQLAPGDIVFARTGATTGKSYLIQSCPDAVFASYLIRLRVADAIYSKYLSTFFESSSYWSQITQVKKGSAQPGVNATILSTLRLPLAPLNEQHRIVAAIETQFTRLDAAVTALKRSQANLKRYRAAVLKAACEGRLVPTEAELAQAEGRSYEPAFLLLDRILTERRQQWMAENPKKRYKEPVAPDTSDLPALPEGWCWASLDIIAQVRTGVAKGRKFNNQYVVSLPYLRVANVQDGYLDLSEIKTIEILPNEIERYRLKPYDILFNEGGDRDKLGRGAIWLGGIKDCIHQNHVFAARLYTSVVDPKWVNFVRQLTYARDHFWKQASQTTNLASINSTNLRSLPIPIPPLSEQVRIITEVERRISLIDNLEKTIKTDLARANRLRQSILKRAFAGQLVPQDLNDEPASILLERIQAAKHGEPVQPSLITGKE